MIESVRLAFAALHGTGVVPPDGSLETAPIDTAPGVWVALDHEWGEHLLLRIDEPEQHLPEPIDAVGITVRELSLTGETVRLIDVGCRVQALTDVFEHFVAAVIEKHGRAPSSPAKTLATVLDTWRRFLHVSPAVRLGRQAAAGLFGELLVLSDLIRANPAAGVIAWAGADRARHDFRIADVALEVKTTLAASANIVSVHGLDQLEEPLHGTLHLHFVRLELVAGAGRSIADLVEEVLEAGAPVAGLYERLDAFGLPVDQISATAEMTFVVRQRATMPVGDQFPRLVNADLLPGRPMPGVTDIDYRIDLSHSLHDQIDDSAYGDLLSAIAAGVAA